jgi:hypothetical protein
MSETLYHFDLVIDIPERFALTGRCAGARFSEDGKKAYKMTDPKTKFCPSHGFTVNMDFKESEEFSEEFWTSWLAYVLARADEWETPIKNLYWGLGTVSTRGKELEDVKDAWSSKDPKDCPGKSVELENCKRALPQYYIYLQDTNGDPLAIPVPSHVAKKLRGTFLPVQSTYGRDFPYMKEDGDGKSRDNDKKKKKKRKRSTRSASSSSSSSFSVLDSDEEPEEVQDEEGEEEKRQQPKLKRSKPSSSSSVVYREAEPKVLSLPSLCPLSGQVTGRAILSTICSGDFIRESSQMHEDSATKARDYVWRLLAFQQTDKAISLGEPLGLDSTIRLLAASQPRATLAEWVVALLVESVSSGSRPLSAEEKNSGIRSTSSAAVASLGVTTSPVRLPRSMLPAPQSPVRMRSMLPAPQSPVRPVASPMEKLAMAAVQSARAAAASAAEYDHDPPLSQQRSYPEEPSMFLSLSQTRPTVSLSQL